MIVKKLESLFLLLNVEAVHSPRTWRLPRRVARHLTESRSLHLCTSPKTETGKRAAEHGRQISSRLSLVLVNVAIAFANFVTGSIRTVQQPFSGLEYLLVWSSFGPFAHCFFNSTAAADLNHHGNGTSLRVPKYNVTV